MAGSHSMDCNGQLRPMFGVTLIGAWPGSGADWHDTGPHTGHTPRHPLATGGCWSPHHYSYDQSPVSTSRPSSNAACWCGVTTSDAAPLLLSPWSLLTLQQPAGAGCQVTRTDSPTTQPQHSLAGQHNYLRYTFRNLEKSKGWTGVYLTAVPPVPARILLLLTIIHFETVCACCISSIVKKANIKNYSNDRR